MFRFVWPRYPSTMNVANPIRLMSTACQRLSGSTAAVLSSLSSSCSRQKWNCQWRNRSIRVFSATATAVATTAVATTAVATTRRFTNPPSTMVPKKIVITADEQRIFDLLLAVVERWCSGTTLRVAGGWVRNKLLGLGGGDIDVALDNRLTGAAFVQFLSEEQKRRRKHDSDTVDHSLCARDSGDHYTMLSGIAVIRSNPEQSKHLETATARVFGESLDFVNLRKEAYMSDSRIPVMTMGTAEEDAFRRDFTLNSMFYNLNTRQIEDFTGCGMRDLHDRMLRTPVEPLVTFREDPLRVMRALRFALIYGLRMDDALVRAARCEQVHRELMLKVSRERIGAEIRKMLDCEHYGNTFDMLQHFGLRNVVLALPLVRAARKINRRGRFDSRELIANHDLSVWPERAWTNGCGRVKLLQKVYSATVQVHYSNPDVPRPRPRPRLIFATLFSELMESKATSLEVITACVKGSLKFTASEATGTAALLRHSMTIWRVFQPYLLSTSADSSDHILDQLADDHMLELVRLFLHADDAHVWTEAVLLAVLRSVFSVTAQAKPQSNAPQCLNVVRQQFGRLCSTLERCTVTQIAGADFVRAIDGNTVKTLRPDLSGKQIGIVLEEALVWQIRERCSSNDPFSIETWLREYSTA